jgi:hypothetical protein
MGQVDPCINGPRRLSFTRDVHSPDRHEPLAQSELKGRGNRCPSSDARRASGFSQGISGAEGEIPGCRSASSYAALAMPRRSGAHEDPRTRADVNPVPVIRSARDRHLERCGNYEYFLTATVTATCRAASFH